LSDNAGEDPAVVAIRALAARIDNLAPPPLPPKVEGLVVPTWVAGSVFAVLLSLVVTMAALMIGVDKRLALIEGNRFTPAQASRMQREITTGPANWGAAAEIRRLENRITQLEGRHGGAP
jgi:hypothetical protein